MCCYLFIFIVIKEFWNANGFNYIIAPMGGLEPPAFRLTAERASQLRHRGK